jgi:hypothetical protein
MVDNPEQYMLMELERKLDQAKELPMQLRPEEVIAIGKDAGLNENQSYRRFARLHREGKVVGEETTVDEHPGWIVFWLEDVQP